MKHETAVLIGSGGMGEVYKAWDPDLQRDVALKYLLRSDPEQTERLKREARVLARIDHPGICKVYEVGVEDDRPFIAMEYIEGRLLGEAALQMSLEEKVLVVKRVAEAIQAAHAEGLIHRDIKPGNIIVSESSSGQLRPHVLDFGIAREQDVRGLTVSGQVLGTPGYLSPEQARGETRTLDRRSDVFSLGVVLYELLGGKKPFSGDSDVQVLVALIENDPKPLRAIASHLPRDLETIVMKCLEKDPDRRYPSARALAEDLGRFLSGESIHARPTGALTRLRQRARRNPKTTLAVAVSLVMIAVLGGLALHTRITASRRASVARVFGRELERMEGWLERAYLLPLHDTRADKKRVRARMDWIAEQLDQLEDPSSRALAHLALGRAHLALGEPRRALERFESAWQLGDRSPELNYGLGMSLAELYRRAVEEAAGIRDARRRKSALEQARRDFREPARSHLENSEGGTDHPSFLAAILADLSERRDQALDELVSLKREDPFFYEGDLLAGSIHRRSFEQVSQSGKAEEMRRAFDAARASNLEAARIGESDPRPYLQLCGLWVGALRNRFWASGGDLSEERDAALAACDKALTADPDSPQTHVELGRAYRYWAANELSQGRIDAAAVAEARRHARAAINADPESAPAYVLLGVTHRIASSQLMARGEDPTTEFEGAVAAFREAIRLRPSDSGAYMSLANALLYLGEDARNRGRPADPFFADAAEAASRAVDLQPEIVGGHVNLGIAHAQLAISARDRQADPRPHFEAAVAALEQAIKLNPSFITAHFNLGETLLERGVFELGGGRDPQPFLDRSLELLEVAAKGYPSWAAPRYLKAEALAYMAEWKISSGADPEEFFGRAKKLIAAARAINPDDATGLTRSSLAALTEARRQRQRGHDPASALSAGLKAVEHALAVNPGLASAHLRRAEFLLERAGWKADHRRSFMDDVKEAAASLEAGSEINPMDPGIPALEAALASLRVADSED